jgi:NADH-quinone oxidoreductase subunit H
VKWTDDKGDRIMETLNGLFVGIANLIRSILAMIGFGDVITGLIMAVVYFVGVIAFILANAVILVYLER